MATPKAAVLLATVLVLVLVLTLLPSFGRAIPPWEYEVASQFLQNRSLSIVHGRDYSLFAESMGLTRVAEQLCDTRATFTLFAVPRLNMDELLTNASSSPGKCLDDAIRSHIAPRRLPFLLRASVHKHGRGLTLPSLIPGAHLHISRRHGAITVNGVKVVAPRIFSSPHLVVHGLDGILVHIPAPPAQPPSHH